MKKYLIVCLVFVAILLQGCVVKSLHPFFNDEDVVYRKELLNAWTDQDGNYWTIKPYKKTAKKGTKGNDKPPLPSYEMHYLHQGEKDVVMLGHLFELGNDLYFDFFPLTDNEEENLAIFDLHLLPTHSIAKVSIIDDNEVLIKWFNEKWLVTLLEQNRIRIAHEEIEDETTLEKDDKYYVLTAPTGELQKFILKYGNDDQSFDDNNTVWLRLKKTS